jgi:hypothetical protein
LERHQIAGNFHAVTAQGLAARQQAMDAHNSVTKTAFAVLGILE